MGMNYTALIGCLLWAMAPGFIAKKKERSFIGYYFLALLVSPLIATIVALCVKNRSAQSYDYDSSTAETIKGFDAMESYGLY